MIYEGSACCIMLAPTGVGVAGEGGGGGGRLL